MLGRGRLKHGRVTDADETDVMDWMADVMADVERAGAKLTEVQPRFQGDQALPPREVPPAPEPPADHQID